MVFDASSEVHRIDQLKRKGDIRTNGRNKLGSPVFQACMLAAVHAASRVHAATTRVRKIMHAHLISPSYPVMFVPTVGDTPPRTDFQSSITPHRK